MIRAIYLTAAGVVFVLAGCASMQVQTDYDPGADLSGYRTYAWLPPPEGGDTRVNNPIVAARIMGAVDRVLTDKGYLKQDSGPVDFMVGYHAAVEGKLEVDEVNTYHGVSWWHSYGPGSGVYTETYVRQYEEGSLIVDVLDYNSKHLVWRGSAQAEVSRTDELEKREERVNKAASKMFKDFPPN